jgi:circadian clock protein KaiB
MSSAADPKNKGFVFRLFVAGDEPHSRRAKDNLKQLCESRIREPVEVEIVDVLESYTVALENKIFLTPALLMVSPEPAVTIFGNLSDTKKVMHALRLGGDD